MCKPVLLAALLLAVLAPVHAADTPDHLSAALDRFDPNIGPDWAYTIATSRGDEKSIERFDPSRAPDSQWTLLSLNGRAPTTEESARHSSYRIATSRSVQPIFFGRNIDRTSLRLVREDTTSWEYVARFRDDLEDPLLAKLELHLQVAKSPTRITSFTLELTEPHSPVLTVKMISLRVETTLASAPDGPFLPFRTSSRFRGRVFFLKDIEENVDSVYSGYTRVTPYKPDPTATAP
jgi:hypothetical protein